MLGYVAIVHICFRYFLVFSLKVRRGLQRQNCSGKTLRSVSHFWIFGKLNCQLRAVLANFLFLKNIQNCSKYHHMDPKFPGKVVF